MQIANSIILAGSVVAALITLVSVAKAVYRFIAKREIAIANQHQQNADIERLKKENTLICYGLIAALDGLEQLGANHTVPKAKDKLEKYINQQAHK